MPGTMTVRIDRRGRLTLPIRIREAYGLRPGSMMTVTDLGGAILLTPGNSEVQAIAEHMSARLAEEYETLDSLLQAAREVRDARAGS